MNSLNHKRILVAGASSGFGLAVATALTAHSAELTLVARRTAPLFAAAGRLKATAIAGDLMDPELRWADSLTGPLDHVYFAAGAFQPGAFLETDPESLRPALEARLWGPARLLRRIHHLLSPQASITFTGGISTLRPNKGAWITNIATALSDQLARTLAIELALLRFNCVAPGFSLTPMWDNLSPEAREGYAAFFHSRTPTQRLTTPEDVAAAVLALMSNPGINGQTIYVDGAYTIA